MRYKQVKIIFVRGEEGKGVNFKVSRVSQLSDETAIRPTESSSAALKVGEHFEKGVN